MKNSWINGQRTPSTGPVMGALDTWLITNTELKGLPHWSFRRLNRKPSREEREQKQPTTRSMSQISGFDYKTTYKGLLALLKAESRKIITFLFLFSSRSLSPQHPPPICVLFNFCIYSKMLNVFQTSPGRLLASVAKLENRRPMWGWLPTIKEPLDWTQRGKKKD